MELKRIKQTLESLADSKNNGREKIEDEEDAALISDLLTYPSIENAKVSDKATALASGENEMTSSIPPIDLVPSSKEADNAISLLDRGIQPPKSRSRFLKMDPRRRHAWWQKVTRKRRYPFSSPSHSQPVGLVDMNRRPLQAPLARAAPAGEDKLKRNINKEDEEDRKGQT